MAWSNSVAYGADATGAVVRMNPETFATNDESTLVTIATENGSVTATFGADPTVRAGVVSMTHGHTDANPGDLTSGDTYVDPLTAMPQASGVAVGLTPGAGPPPSREGKSQE
jgi:hypothetical protein